MTSSVLTRLFIAPGKKGEGEGQTNNLLLKFTFLVCFRNRMAFRVFNKTKPGKYGINYRT